MDITQPKTLALKILLGDQILDFDSSNLSPPPAKMAGKNILFSAAVPYNQAEIRAMDRERKLEFLFNPAFFIDCMKRWEKAASGTDPLTPSRNVQTTLTMLWSNTFPLPNNLQVSSAIATPNLLEGPGILEQFNRGMQKLDSGIPPYAAVRQGEKVYTVQKATWLNDVVNNPLYKPLLQAVYSYDIWTKFKLPDVLNREIDIAWKAFQKQKPDVGDFLKHTADVVNQTITVAQSPALQASIASITQIRNIFGDFQREFQSFATGTRTPTSKLYGAMKTIYDNIEAIQEPSMKSQFTNAFSFVKPLYSIFRIWNTQNDGGIFVGTDEFLQRIPEYMTLRQEMDKYEKTVLKCDNDEFINGPIREFLTPLGETNDLRNLAGYVCHDLLKYGETALKKLISEFPKGSTLPNLKYEKVSDLTTGLVYLKDGNLTVYVCLDAINDEITPENRAKYACPVKGEVLGQLSEVLLGMKYAGNPYEIVSHVIGPVLAKGGRRTRRRRRRGGSRCRRRNPTKRRH